MRHNLHVRYALARIQKEIGLTDAQLYLIHPYIKALSTEQLKEIRPCKPYDFKSIEGYEYWFAPKKKEQSTS